MASISSGGIVRLTINGVVYPVRGNVKVDITDFERSEGANMDGSVYTTTKPVPPTVEVNLSDGCGLSLRDLMSIRCQDITVEMPEVGRTVVFVDGTLVGRPSLNPDDGSISNVKFVGASTREINDPCPC